MHQFVNCLLVLSNQARQGDVLYTGMKMTCNTLYHAQFNNSKKHKLTPLMLNGDNTDKGY